MIHTENSILMKAPLDRVFETASDLSRWPEILPHYRWIRYLEQSPAKNTVVMAAWRIVPQLGGMKIPVHWTSEQQVDRSTMEIRFHHLKSFTRGMVVVWTFRPAPEGVQVRITHDFVSRIPLVGVLIEPIVCHFFVHFIANQTLKYMRASVEDYRGP